jgi:hypothetical protein
MLTTTNQIITVMSMCPNENNTLLGRTEKIVVTAEDSPNSLIIKIKKSLFVICLRSVFKNYRQRLAIRRLPYR